MRRPPETTTRRFVLASASPRRAWLLRRSGFLFETAPSSITEDFLIGESPRAGAVRLAAEKAAAVAGHHPEAVVLGLDTIVVLDGEILGKPAGPADAAAMLGRLGGRRHEVITGYTVLAGGGVQEHGAAATTVEFRPVGREEIDAYVASGEPLDKAGAYALQGGAARFVTCFEGSRSNVIGVPLEEVVPILLRLGVAGRDQRSARNVSQELGSPVS